jgi:hypothetical protein
VKELGGKGCWGSWARYEGAVAGISRDARRARSFMTKKEVSVWIIVAS